MYNEEQFLRGARAKIAVHPRLYLNDISADIKIIENFSAKVVLVNEKDIPKTFNFQQLKLDDKNDILLEIPI